METDKKKDSGVSANSSQLRKSTPIEGTHLLIRETLIALSTTNTEATTTKDRETLKLHFVDAAELEIREVLIEVISELAI